MRTPIYNIPIGREGRYIVYIIYTNISPLYKAPSFSPLFMGALPPVRIPSYIWLFSGQYKRLVEEYNWTSLVYKSTYNFQPILGEHYHLYENKNKDLFLSLIEPSQWKQTYIGTFKLLNNGKWEKV